jgi:pilus assembly protein CpaC
MRRCSLYVAALFAVLSAPAAAQEIITIGVGQQKIIQIPNLERVAVGDPEIADVKVVGRSELLVLGVAEGRTTLLVWKDNGQRVSYTISVRKQDPKDIISEVRALLGEREGIQLRIVGDRVYMDGEALTTEDYDRVQEITKIYPQVKSFVRVSHNAKRLAAAALNQAFEKASLPGVRAVAVGSKLFLEGSAESKEDLTRAELIVKAVGETAENLLVVGRKKMVMIDVQIMEIRRSGQINLGVRWPLDLQGGGTAQISIAKGLWDAAPVDWEGQVQGGFNVASDARVSLRWDDGYGRLLSRPRLVCASGEKAEFHVGGEVPVVIITQQSINIDYKKFGVIVKLTPTADRDGNIKTDMSVAVSDIDASLTVRIGNTEVPGFRVREVETSVTVRDRDTIVLSGLFNNDQQKNVSKVPLLGHIPILGELFKSREFQEKKNEIVIFVQPMLVVPDSEAVRRQIEGAQDRYKSAEDQVHFNIFD